MFSAGRVLLMPKGAYNPLTTYEMLDIVSYNGSSYIAKGTTTGNLPTDTTYWQLSAYGGQAANIAGNFAELESSSVATATHYVDDIFVDENSQLMKATQTINIGDTIDANVNCAPTTVEALIAYLSSYVDSLDSLNKKIQGAIEIAAQTDLHSLAIGEYYKKQSTFYITNGPTGIDQEPTAIFRLTVEAALDNASQASSPLLLTLRTPDGKIYTQSYDGTNWGSWVEVASAASVSALNTAKQPKTLDTPITVGGVQQTTVEGALGSINQTLTNKVANEIATRAKVSGHNFVPNNAISSGIFSANSDGTITANGTNTEDVWYQVSGRFVLPKGSYILSGMSTNPSTQWDYDIEIYNPKTSTFVANQLSTEPVAFTLSEDTEILVQIFVKNGISLSNVTFYPMLRLATDESADYEPYSMTNQELTPIAQAVSNRNLLDNPWFTVNQRGFASDSNPSAGTHLVDRWAVRYNPSTGSVAVNDGIVTLTSADKILIVGERFEKSVGFSGKMLTASIMLSDGTILSGTGIFPNENGADVNVINTSDLTVYYQYSSASGGYPFLGITCKANKTLSIKAVKLELGSVSTLAMDIAPNYATELLKCQRYFVRFKPTSGYAWIGMGIGEGGTLLQVLIDLPTVMRVNPTISYADIGVWSSNENGMLSSIANASVTGNKLHANITSDASFTAGRAVCLWLNSAINAYIDLSADL